MARQALNTEDIIGQVFGRLTVVSYSHLQEDNERRKHFYNVRCSCGVEKLVTRNTLITGSTKSCGCLSREVAAIQKRKINAGYYDALFQEKYKRNIGD